MGKNGITHSLCAGFLIVACCLTLWGAGPSAAYALNIQESVNAAVQTEGENFSSVAAALAEQLMDEGISAGMEPSQLAVEIGNAVLASLQGKSISEEATLRAIAQMTLGIRASARKHGLNEAAIQAALSGALGAQGELYARIVDQTFQGDVADTYTGSGTGGGGGGAPSFGSPPAGFGIPGGFGSTASPS